MLQKCITPLKSLLAVVLALSLVLMVQPAEALAGTAKVTFDSAGNGKVSGDYELDLSTSATVYDSGAVVMLGELRNPSVIQPNTGYVFDYWTADAILYRSRYFLFVDPAPIGYHISSFSEEFYTASDVTLTAHFKRQPAKVTYKADGHGSVSKSDESVELNEEYSCGAETLSVGKTSGTTATPTDGTKYALDYWTADKDIYKLEDDKLTTIPTGTQLNSTEGYFVTGDVTFTAHFKQIAADVTYESAGHGSVSRVFEKVTFSEKTIDAAGTKAMAGTPTGATPSPEEDYSFKYWTASTDVIVSSDFSTITAGSEISNDQLSSILVTGDVTFTAHFKRQPAKVTYKADGNGSVSKSDESVELNEEHPCGAETLSVGKLGGTTATPTDGTKYALDYWTADKAVYKYENNQLTTIDAGTKLTSIADYYVAEDVIFTAHFRQIAATITYVSAGHGTAGTDSVLEQLNKTGMLPDSGASIALAQSSNVAANPEENYEFAYWKANKDVYICNSETGELTVYTAGQELTSTTYLVSEDITFTAYFKHKPVTVTYTADANGSVGEASESVEIDKECKSGEDMLPVGKLAGSTATPTDSTKYAFDYWTADKDVYICENDQLTAITAGTKLTSPEGYYVAEGVTFTAHFKRTAYGVTYKTVAHGAVSPTTERVAVGNTPTGCTVTPDDGYDFEYWTANVDVEVAGIGAESEILTLTASNAESEAATTTIAAGDPITDEQLKRAVSFSDDPVFTAHFKLASNKIDGSDDAGDGSDDTDSTDTTSTASTTNGTSNSNSSNDSGSTNDTSATGNSSGNLTATGDTLGVVAIIVFLCAGVAAALVALFSRRSCHGNHRSSKKR